MAPFHASASLPLSNSLTNALPSRIWYLGTPLAVAAATAGATIIGPAWLPLGLMGAVLGFTVVVMLNAANKRPAPFVNAGIIETPFLLSHDKQVFELYRRLAGALLRVNQQSDFVFRDLALEQVTRIADDMEYLASGNIVFSDTETWRLAYERLLRSPGTSSYRSVAVIKTEKYWSDEPGRRSIRLNQELASAGLIAIQRIAVISDELWPKDSVFPKPPIKRWLEEQHAHGIQIHVVRMASVASEPDLVVDTGIYGSRALGTQELDAEGRTVRFTLTFDFDRVLDAEERWDRLSLYATPFDELAER